MSCFPFFLSCVVAERNLSVTSASSLFPLHWLRLIMYKSLKGMRCLSPPKTYM